MHKHATIDPATAVCMIVRPPQACNHRPRLCVSVGVRDRGVATLPVARGGGAGALCVHQKPEGGLVSVPALLPRQAQ